MYGKIEKANAMRSGSEKLKDRLKKFLFLFYVQFAFLGVYVVKRNIVLGRRRRIFASKLKVSIFWIYRGGYWHANSERRWAGVFR